MSFPHHIVTRVSWVVSAGAAVVLLARALRPEETQIIVTSAEVAEVPDAFDWEMEGQHEKADQFRLQEVEELIERLGSENVIVALNMVGDGESLLEGFTLAKPYDVRVTALGEGTGNEMHDYGMIVDAATRRTVWEMDMGDTHHAGGADKNRMIDEVVTLDAGSYLVQYVTDDSHSYGDFNQSPPADPELWGITILGAHGPVDREVVRPFEEAENADVLARIVRVGDDEYHQEHFSLDRTGEVLVYAIGEGDQSDMYDFARIEEARTGRTIWAMRYRETDHAGGAEKNRLYEGVVRLEAGEYRLVYQTDGSHSFRGWNSPKPNDQFNYGVTVFRR